jgi:hypothetical protein
VNYMAISPLMTLFLESVSTGEQGHNADWIASDIERVMAYYPKTTLAGAVTDNTSTNKNAWEKLSKKSCSLLPGLYFAWSTVRTWASALARSSMYRSRLAPDESF